MAPRKLRQRSKRSSTENKVPCVIKKPDNIQTEDNYNIELTNCQKQIKLLQQEVEDYKKQIISLQSENNILKTQVDKFNVIVNKDINRGSLIEKNEKLLSSGGIKIKGCSCKGNCSNKICGCVKKNMSCQDFCKCSQASCKNQDPDKENVEQAVLSKDGQKVLEKLGGLTLNQEVLHASQKKVRRSIFSPFSTNRETGNADRITSISPLTFVTKRRLFTQNSDEVVDINSEIEHEDNSDIATNSGLNVDPIDQQVPSVFVENVDKKCSEVEIVSSKISKNSTPHSPQVARKSKSVSPGRSPGRHVVRRKIKIKKTTVKNKSNSVSPVRLATDQVNYEKDEPQFHRVEHSPQPIINNLEPTIEVQNIEGNKISEDTLCGNVHLSVPNSYQSNLNKTSFNSNTSVGSSNSNNDNLTDEIDSDSTFHPMIPKRQLPRSPILGGIGDVRLSMTKKFSPPKKELAVAEVDWDQHQSELVSCKICKRKFFPHRIDIHIKSCKGI